MNPVWLTSLFVATVLVLTETWMPHAGILFLMSAVGFLLTYK